MDVAFDTTALSTLVAPEILARAANTFPISARLVVPHTALLELLDGRDEQRAIERLQALKELRRQLGTRMIVSANLDAILARESRGPSLFRCMAIGQDDDGKGARFLLSPSPFDIDRLRDLRRTLPSALAKQWAVDTDRFARRDAYTLATGVDAKKLRQRLLDRFSDSALSNDNPVFDGIKKRYGDQSRAIRKSPGRFRTTVMYAAYSYRVIVGAIFADVGGPPTDLRGPRRGSWIDAKIAACAAYARVLVTDDDEQRAKVAHISKAFSFGMSAMTVDQWLSDCADVQKKYARGRPLQ